MNDSTEPMIIKLIRDLVSNRFYGSIEIKLEAGHVVVIRKTETILPFKPNRENRGKFDEQHK